ncbi:phosphohydrolase [Bradyrhizobium sp. HKCCYLR1023]|uniref:phosphohydrolase n=1 Tax=Bradyrhizobium TaxID=374 RepID=UPI003EBC6159
MKIVQPRRGDWMQTAGGRAFWPLDPRPNEIDIEEIAHALGMLCRYGGHCLRFYSVAEHSVLLSRAAPKPHKKWALLHDASEAFLHDLVRPVKRSVTGYAELEADVMRAVCVRFKLHLDMPSIIKLLDRRLLADEQIQNMAPAPMPWSDMAEPLGMTLQFWSPERAKREFLDEFERLGGLS